MRRDNPIVIFAESICGVGVPSLELGAAKAQRARKEERYRICVLYIRNLLKLVLMCAPSSCDGYHGSLHQGRTY